VNVRDFAVLMLAFVAACERRAEPLPASPTPAASSTPVPAIVVDSGAPAEPVEDCSTWSGTWREHMARPIPRAGRQAIRPVWCASYSDEGDRRDPFGHLACVLDEPDCRCAEAVLRRGLYRYTNGPYDIQGCRPVRTLWCFGAPEERECLHDRRCCEAERRRLILDGTITRSVAPCVELAVR
jgi:hypothetical protein